MLKHSNPKRGRRVDGIKRRCSIRDFELGKRYEAVLKLSSSTNKDTSGGPPFLAARQPNVESEYSYGSRSGIWRLLRIFAEHQYKFTLLAVGQALEMNPAVAKACVEAGHEIAGHGYRWLDCRDLPPEEEKELVKRAIKAIQNTAGVDPAGWYVGRISPNSVGVVWEAFEEMGLHLKWQSDFYGDDVPVWTHLPAGLATVQEEQAARRLVEEEEDKGEKKPKEGLLHVPYSYDCNDMKFHFAADGFGGASFYEYLVDAFDMLYEEGGKMMSIGLHGRIVGKPGRARQLQRFLNYISSKPDVWVCTRADIAMHWRERFPYQPVTNLLP
ncbi:uncharacterized protein Z519_04965 [Cladophialophora bantiana CBS 173.52]|uniref:NodB homology domain-containing protein n=1 Tax=Cladophialophora bantiana (strain ATCC 10958 / CBS 173.52 / CDC B-1940 / NIH 8579) TaxID=1442370 RepID=A0A0D2HVQ4_CLAB1|nr:uncharacterized protein Z519_04965 [Cladophialophora bantiana CBS 173.52]KIW94985.1 hypothetical protein Z519_04965 [Cladophialophora bantiana CBS 173.52]